MFSEAKITEIYYLLIKILDRTKRLATFQY